MTLSGQNLVRTFRENGVYNLKLPIVLSASDLTLNVVDSAMSQGAVKVPDLSELQEDTPPSDDREKPVDVAQVYQHSVAAVTIYAISV